MAISALTYTVLHLAVAAVADAQQNAVGVPGWVVMIASSLCGAGAAVLWTAQGAYCTAISQRYGTTIERCQTFFMAFMALSGIVGFAVALLLIDGLQMRDTVVLWTVAALSLLAVLAYTFLLPAIATTIDPAKNSDAIDCRGKVLGMMSLFRRLDVVLVAVAFLHLGCQEGLYWGAVAQHMGSSLLVQSFLLHGVCSAVSSMLVESRRLARFAPWLSNEGKAIWLVVISLIGQIMVTIALHPKGMGLSQWWSASLLFLATGCFGISDLTAQALLRATLSRIFEGSLLLEAAISSTLFTLTLGNILMFLAGPRIPAWWQAIFATAIGMASVCCLAVRIRLRLPSAKKPGSSQDPSSFSSAQPSVEIEIPSQAIGERTETCL